MSLSSNELASLVQQNPEPSEFEKEYEKIVDKYYKAIKKNKENEKKISALNGELTFYRSQELKNDGEKPHQESAFRFNSEFPIQESELWDQLSCRQSEPSCDGLNDLFKALSNLVDDFVEKLQIEINANPLIPLSPCFHVIRKSMASIFESTYSDLSLELILHMTNFRFPSQNLASPLYYLSVRFLSSIYEPILKKIVEDISNSENEDMDILFTSKLSLSEASALLGKLSVITKSILGYIRGDPFYEEYTFYVEQTINLSLRFVVRMAVLWPYVKNVLSKLNNSSIVQDYLTDTFLIDYVIESFRTPRKMFNNSYSSIIQHSIYELVTKLKSVKLNSSENALQISKKAKQRDTSTEAAGAIGLEPATSSSFLDSTIIQKTEFLLTKCVRINTNKMRLLPIDISKLPVFIVIEMLMNTFLSCTQQDLIFSNIITEDSLREKLFQLSEATKPSKPVSENLQSEDLSAQVNDQLEQQSPEQIKVSILSSLSDNIVQCTQSQLRCLSECPKEYLFWMQIVTRLSTVVDSIAKKDAGEDASFGKVFGYISESLLKFLSFPGSLNSERVTLALLWLHHEWYYKRFTRCDKRLEKIFNFIISSFCDEVKCSLVADNSYTNLEDQFENSTLESQVIKDTVALLLESRDANLLNLSYFLALSPIATANILQSNLYSVLSSAITSHHETSPQFDGTFQLGAEELSLRRLCYVLGVTCKLCKLRPKVRSFLVPVLLQFLTHRHKGYRHFSIHIILEKLMPSLEDKNEFFLLLLKDFALNQLRELSLDSTIMEKYYGHAPGEEVKKEQDSSARQCARSAIEAKSDLFFALCMRYPSFLCYFYDNWRVYFAEDVIEEGGVEGKAERDGEGQGEDAGIQVDQVEGDASTHRRKMSPLRQTILNIYNSQNRIELVNNVLRVYPIDHGNHGGNQDSPTWNYVHGAVAWGLRKGPGFGISTSFDCGRRKIAEKGIYGCRERTGGNSEHPNAQEHPSCNPQPTFGRIRHTDGIANYIAQPLLNHRHQAYCIGTCLFELKESFKQEVVLSSLQSLIDSITLPPSTVLDMVANFAVSFMKMIPVSLQIVIQLPKEQLAAAIAMEPELGSALKEFFKQQPSSFRNRFLWVIDLLSSSSCKSSSRSSSSKNTSKSKAH
ncbi:hypothetical protein DI09_105p20 [Mitosporidium daphniae]|uniref:Uncharacterized protein n=1 Tax=Mitosporidium daphniae TaxID=1485682 RepID=A0A098VWC5_9MICR|nr:uncharacterized protein DI09_105p20 [Mitosporidium daphniae]KGG53189.1 hypothetical protein DI09_105p20 [Mitosporidium daphniae]|eukprot:XP_013239625.1 uncharacterized protein DI09_105p20 [Mitosporidium daphniae]